MVPVAQPNITEAVEAVRFSVLIANIAELCCGVVKRAARRFKLRTGERNGANPKQATRFPCRVMRCLRGNCQRTQSSHRAEASEAKQFREASYRSHGSYVSVGGPCGVEGRLDISHLRRQPLDQRPAV